MKKCHKNTAHPSYALPLDIYSRLSSRCSNCASSYQLYQVTGEARDIPCHRSELLLRIYRRYFTYSGIIAAKPGRGFILTDDYLDEMAESFYHCTACQRCKSAYPMGIDHGLITHLARWLLAEIDLVPKALVVAVREQLNTSRLLLRSEKIADRTTISETDQSFVALGDYALPLVIAIPLASGCLVMHPTWNPLPYSVALFVHIMSANVIMLLMPLTKLAHAVLLPGVQLMAELGWHWPPDDVRCVDSQWSRASVRGSLSGIISILL